MKTTKLTLEFPRVPGASDLDVRSVESVDDAFHAIKALLDRRPDLRRNSGQDCIVRDARGQIVYRGNGVSR